MFLSLFVTISSTFAVKDIMEVMFQPAKEQEKIIDLWADKNTVGNEVFKESTQFWLKDNAGKWCFVNGQHITESAIKDQIASAGYNGTPSSFCQDVLGGDQDTSAFGSQTQAPLIVRITKFLLRITVVLAITMVLYNGVMWIVESAKGGDVKESKDNLLYIIGGILVALSSVALINLISSISLSSLNPEKMPDTQSTTVVSQ